MISWERGVDRVADLEIMPDARNIHEFANTTELFYKMETNKDTGMRVKNVQLNEEWEKFWVSFMIFHPSEDNYDELLFDCPKVGVNMMPMTLMPQEFTWMNPKYGKVMRPW